METRELSYSHVIPEFLYTEMYDEKHRFHVLSTKTPEKPRHQQKGIRERLLCADCETKLSVAERYVSLILSGQVPIHTARNGDLVEVQGLDYEKFRLFGLSILWRAQIASHAFFKEVDLGHHAEPIRDFLARGDPGPPHKYGFFLSPLVMGDKDVTDLIVEPTKSRLGAHRCYRFVFGGLIWVFAVSSHRAPSVFDSAFIDLNGRMLMLVSDLREVKFLRDTMERAVAKAKKNAF